jgi:TolA-binding protein
VFTVTKIMGRWTQNASNVTLLPLFRNGQTTETLRYCSTFKSGTVLQLHQDMHAGAATVQGLQQQLRQLSAELDLLERNADQASEGRVDDEEELTLAASVASQQESLAAEMMRSMRQANGQPKAAYAYRGDIVPPNSAALHPSSLALTLNAHLDIQYIGDLVSCNVPMFKAAG